MQKLFKYRIYLILIAIIICGSIAWAQDLKDRMLDRLPQIIELKGKGLIGENNLGFLEIRGNGQAHKVLVDAENQDRRQVYSAIAKKNNISMELVGQRRAIQIAEKANKGEWLQASDGKWYQKP